MTPSPQMLLGLFNKLGMKSPAQMALGPNAPMPAPQDMAPKPSIGAALGSSPKMGPQGMPASPMPMPPPIMSAPKPPPGAPMPPVSPQPQQRAPMAQARPIGVPPRSRQEAQLNPSIGQMLSNFGGGY